MLKNITVSPSPHITEAHSTRSIMLDVIIGLSPAVLAAWWFFRLHAVMVIAVCVAGCAATEWVCNLIRKKSNSLDDLSAIVTGIILALSLPPAIPLWAAAVGSIIAIAIGKMVFGGLGSNTFNPAMVARTFMAISLGSLMTTWTLPATIDVEMPAIKISGKARPNVVTQVTIDEEMLAFAYPKADAVTQATPLGWSKQAIKGESDIENANSLKIDAMLGPVGGCLGETCSLALLLGGAYMLFRRTITYVIPAAVLGSAAVFAAICFFINPDKFADPGFHLISGGMLLCAFFIATDPVTVPITQKGMWIFGIGTGVVIMLIRNIGGYPEGVMFAILLMNALTPLIDRACKLTPYGGKKND